MAGFKFFSRRAKTWLRLFEVSLPMKNTRRIHDGIVGVIILIRVALEFYVNPNWLWASWNRRRCDDLERFYRLLPRLFFSSETWLCD